MKQLDLSGTSLSLIELARANNADAWRELAHIYSPLVANWVRQGGLQENDTEDIVQDVFRIVSVNLQRFRKDSPDHTFRGWLWTITRNEIRGWYRKRSKSREIAAGGSDAANQMAAVPDWITSEIDVDELAPDPHTETQLIRRTAKLIRQDFQEQTWTAFWRSAVEGHSTADIAADLNMKPNAIRQAKLRVLTRFRDVLDS